MGRDVPVKAGLLALALLGAACGWRGPSPVATAGGIQPYDNVLAMDRAAWRYVAAGPMRESRSEDGRLGVELELYNLTGIDLTVQVRTVYRDRDGMPTRDQANWEMITIPRRSSWLYHSRSLDEASVSYTIEIRSP